MPGTASSNSREQRFANAAALTEALALDITGALQDWRLEFPFKVFILNG